MLLLYKDYSVSHDDEKAKILLKTDYYEQIQLMYTESKTDSNCCDPIRVYKFNAIKNGKSISGIVCIEKTVACKDSIHETKDSNQSY